MESIKYLSCQDLQSSLYLGPDEIRACCQRFFVNGEQKGDVVLIKGDNENLFTPQKIVEAKNRLIEEINTTENNECSGCPKLKFNNWEPITNLQTTNLSLEYHSVCNLKCTYCSEKFFGGLTAKYDLNLFFDYFREMELLDKLNIIRWGGGEPFLDPKSKYVFDFIDEVAEKNSNLRVNIFSNALRTSEYLLQRIGKGTYYLITSLDAGTEETYKKVRKKSGLNKVLENLSKYSNSGEGYKYITLKYIVMEDNIDDAEIVNLAEKLKNTNLTKSGFQISLDFTQEKITSKQLIFVLELYLALKNIGFEKIFLDDLLWARLGKEFRENRFLKNYLLNHFSSSQFGFHVKNENFIVYGTGDLTQQIIGKSIFFERNKLSFITDSFIEFDHDKRGLKYKKLQSLLESQDKIIIAATQSYLLIYNKLINLGISPSRIYSGLVI